MTSEDFTRFLLAWIALLGLACGSGHDALLTTKLEGRVFLLDSAEGFEPVADTNVRLSFDEGELSFSAGCNSHSGGFRLHEGRLIVPSLSSTEIGCDPARHAQDDWLAEFFTSRPRVQLEGDQLTLLGAQASLIFVDREVADPDRPLAATPWTIDTLIDGDSASSVASAPSIRFEDDGSLKIDTSCNTASGHYAVRANRLTLTDVAYTEKACSAMTASIDAHVQAVLRDGTLDFEIQAARLTLTRGTLGVGALAP